MVETNVLSVIENTVCQLQKDNNGEIFIRDQYLDIDDEVLANGSTYKTLRVELVQAGEGLEDESLDKLVSDALKGSVVKDDGVDSLLAKLNDLNLKSGSDDSDGGSDDFVGEDTRHIPRDTQPVIFNSTFEEILDELGYPIDKNVGDPTQDTHPVGISNKVVDEDIDQD